MPRMLMCAPDYYGVEYEINPWMDRQRAPDHALAGRQWARLRELLAAAGATIELVEPAVGLPDMVFTANAGLVVGDRVILSNFRHPERQGEAALFADWFRGRGFEVMTLPPERSFEGAGDALFVGEDLWAGYRFRSDIYSHQLLGELLGRRVISLELVDPRFYHLDTCFCPLGPDAVAYYPGAFDAYAQRVIESHLPRLIRLEEPDAARFGANAVRCGQRILLNSGCESFVRSLRDWGWEPWETDLSEYLKAGGAARCLTLDLDGAPGRLVASRLTQTRAGYEGVGHGQKPCP